jgi:hypothetical protein
VVSAADRQLSTFGFGDVRDAGDADVHHRDRVDLGGHLETVILIRDFAGPDQRFVFGVNVAGGVLEAQRAVARASCVLAGQRLFQSTSTAPSTA